MNKLEQVVARSAIRFEGAAVGLSDIMKKNFRGLEDPPFFYLASYFRSTDRQTNNENKSALK